MPVGQPANAPSRVLDFIDIHHGPGVQHIALTTETIADAFVRSMRKASVPFVEIPASYYEVMSAAAPGAGARLKKNWELQELGILADGDMEDLTLYRQVTQGLVGPFFFELIQRHGNEGASVWATSPHLPRVTGAHVSQGR